MTSFKNERVVGGVVDYLRSRATSECDGLAEYSLLSKAADIITDAVAEISRIKELNVKLQRQVGEFEAREGGLE